MIVIRRLVWALLALAAAGMAPCALAQDVTVELLRMGVGSHVRPGDCTGILVRLTSNLTEPVQARVQWELPNADGDTAQYAREVPLAPGAPTERWLYGVLPMHGASVNGSLEAVSVVRVLQMEDDRPVRELATVRINGAAAAESPTGVEVTDGLIGVVGDGRAGLAPFSPVAGQTNLVPSMNEVTLIARGMEPGSLPDHWEGYASFEALVWANAPVQNLGAEQARALTDWVRRGGHLVVLLPESGDPWGLLQGKGGRTPLAAVLPQGGVTRRDGVPVRELMPLISRDDVLRNEAARTGLWLFDTSATGNGFEPLMAMPSPVDQRTGNLNPTFDTLQGQVVAVRRTLGFGAVTLVGIDADGLERRQLNPNGLPQADVFWNRILGRRADAPSAQLWQQIDAAKRAASSPIDVEVRGGPLVQGEIGMQGQAAIGVLTLIVAFGVYWVLAGPALYLALRAVKKVNLAWLGFVTVALASTALVWVLTGVDEFSRGRVQHLSFVDRIEAPGMTAEERATVRVTSWFSAELPGYGPTRVSLEHRAGAAGPDAIWTWFAPPAGDNSGFPDTERYLVPINSPADYDVPSRATSAVFSSAWMGDPERDWAGLPRVVDGQTLRQDIIWRGGAVPTVLVQGQLVHSLAAPLQNVALIYVMPWRSPARKASERTPFVFQPSAMLPNYTRIRVRSEWAPGEVLDLAQELFGSSSRDEDGAVKRRTPSAALANSAADSLDSMLKATYVTPWDQYQGGFDFRSQVTDPLTAAQKLQLLGLYSMLIPPDYLRSASNSSSPSAEYNKSVRYHRDLARTVDLARWFTRPCVIVVGTLVDNSSTAVTAPFPIRIDEREVNAEGRTIVRAIFPLPEPMSSVAPAVE